MTSTVRQTATTRLASAMARELAPDPGLGALTTATGRPTLPDHLADRQDAWARAALALWDDRARTAYLAAADARQATVTARPATWDAYTLSTRPISDSAGDRYGVLCDCCAYAYPAVSVDGGDSLCVGCARRWSSPETSAPLWRAASHSRWTHPTGRPTTLITYGDGERREYSAGESALTVPGLSTLPGYVLAYAEAVGADRDTPTVVHSGRAERGPASVDILATYTYDPGAEGVRGWDPAVPYGYRLTACRLTCDRRPMGHYASPEGGTVTECTDILDVLDAVLTHLYGPLP
ncbi:hypothetical protein HX747_31015 [Streptomyces sp. L06]|nr:hypothetical protein [Streptomyces sp. L06]